MNIFLTGGTGLVGSHTLDRLVGRGDSVTALVRSPAGAKFVRENGATAITADIQSSDFWRSVKADAIVHCAAVLPRRATWSDFDLLNRGATGIIARRAAESGARLVYISTVAVYGSAGYAGDGSPIVEDTPFEQLDTYDYYGRSKRAAELELWRVSEDTGLSAVALRPCVVYGEHDRLFSPKIVSLLRFGYWPLVGSGENHLGVVYAGNVADAVIAALDRPGVSGAFNTTNDGAISQRDFFRSLGDGAGYRVRCFRIPRVAALGASAMLYGYRKAISLGRYGGFAGVAGRWLSRQNPYSSEKALTELGWQPSTEPVEAATRTGAWMKHQQTSNH